MAAPGGRRDQIPLIGFDPRLPLRLGWAILSSTVAGRIDSVDRRIAQPADLVTGGVYIVSGAS